MKVTKEQWVTKGSSEEPRKPLYFFTQALLRFAEKGENFRMR